MAKIRLFLLTEKTGAPVAQAPVLLWEEVDGETGTRDPTILRYPLGTFASDRSGYVSVPLQPLRSPHSRIVIQPFADKTLEIILPAAPADDEEIAIPVVVPQESVPSDLLPPGFLPPGLMLPDLIDRRISPRSFGSEGAIFLGESGCEDLLHSAVTEHTFRFSYVLREPLPCPMTLSRITPCQDQNLRPEFVCDEDLPDSETACWWPGVVLEYEMTFTPAGHFLGELVYGTSLAPCESVNLAVIDWVRRDQFRRGDTTVLREAYAASLDRDRAVQETVSGMLREWQRGGSILGGIAAAFPIGQVGAGTAALGGGYTTSSGDRSVTADTGQRLLDGVRQSATNQRRLNSTVVVEASQAERDVVETRTIANHNHCHTLNLLFYEVLRHYRVDVKLANKQDAILVKRPQFYFEEENISSVFRYRRVLEAGLLNPELAKCFPALDKLRIANSRFERRAYASEPPEYLLGSLRIRLTTGTVAPTHGRVRLELITLAGEEIIPLQLIEPDPFVESNELLVSRGGEVVERLTLGSEEIIEVEPAEPVRWANVRSIRLTLYLAGASESSGRYSGHAATSWQLRHARIETKHDGHHWVLFDGPPVSSGPLTFENDDSVDLPRQTWGPREPRDLLDDNDLDCLHLLLEHLREHHTYYSRLIRLAEDPQDWARWLDAYTRHSGDSGPRLLDEVENRIAGVIGDYYAFPDTSPLKDGEPTRSDSVVDPESDFTSYIALPTRGAFGEAKLGHCNACEKRDPTRFWDWSESPCPEHAPPITGISPGSRARDIGVEPIALPEPTAGPQEVPPAPDPGQMMKGVLDLLATPEIFRDMSASKEVAEVLGKLIEGAVALASKRVDGQTQVRLAELDAEQEDAAAGTGGEQGTPTRTGNGGSTQPISRVPSESPGGRTPSAAARAYEDTVALGEMGLSAEEQALFRRQRASRLARGGSGESADNIVFFLSSKYDNGTPLYGSYDISYISPTGQYGILPFDATSDAFGVRVSVPREGMPVGTYAFSGNFCRTRLPATLTRNFTYEMPGSIPDISIPLASHFGLEDSTTWDRERECEMFELANGDFTIESGQSVVFLDATAPIIRRSIELGITLSASVSPGFSMEETISNEIKAHIEGKLRRIIGLALDQTLGWAGRIGVTLSGTFELEGTVTGELEYSYIESVRVVERRE